jgi:hypothetical protein
MRGNSPLRITPSAVACRPVMRAMAAMIMATTTDSDSMGEVSPPCQTCHAHAPSTTGGSAINSTARLKRMKPAASSSRPSRIAGTRTRIDTASTFSVRNIEAICATAMPAKAMPDISGDKQPHQQHRPGQRQQVRADPRPDQQQGIDQPGAILAAHGAPDPRRGAIIAGRYRICPSVQRWSSWFEKT